MMILDHVVLGAPNLEAAIVKFESLTGCKPVMGGSHKGLGTRNALVAFDNGLEECYLEILAPDPQQAPLNRKLGGELAKLPSSMEPFHYAIRSSQLPCVQDFAESLGFQPGSIKDLSRAKPDGTLLQWKMLFLEGHELGGLVPFYLDWLECDHPTKTIPIVGTLKKVVVETPKKHQLDKLLQNVNGIECLHISTTEDYLLSFTFQSPKGTVSFSSSAPQGIYI